MTKLNTFTGRKQNFDSNELDASGFLPVAEPLDKLAQVDQNKNVEDDSAFESLDKGVLIESIDTLVSRASAKYVSSHIAKALHSVGSTLHSAYSNTYSCGSIIHVKNGAAVQKRYCKNRWCTVCNRIRTAVLINDYEPIVSSWGEDARFVTVTIKNCKADSELLWMTIKRMNQAFESIRRRFKRTLKLPFVALRKIECTYNKQRHEYHPHYHITFAHSETAEQFVKEWLAEFPYNPASSTHFQAHPDAQHIREVDNGALKELFKYFTKIFAKSGKKDSKGVDLYEFDSVAMDGIFRAMKGMRTFQTYGFKKSDYKHLVSDKIELLQDDDLEKITETVTDTGSDQIPSDGIYCWREDNWYNDITGEALTSFQITKKMRRLIEGIIYYEYDTLLAPC